MVYKLECSLEKQDCATLYPTPPGGLYHIPYTDQSCVRDNRLEGNVGRCGFPGAFCSVDNIIVEEGVTVSKFLPN